MKPILIVDDEKAIANLIRLTLSAAGYACETASGGAQAADLLERNRYDLVLLDIMMPEVDGYDLLAYLLPLGVPAIFLTAKGTLQDRVKGLHMGADDYIVKPFEPAELVARVESVLRRAGRGATVLTAWDVIADPVSHSVTKQGVPVALTPKEFELLAILMRNRGCTMYRDYLYESVWGDADTPDTRTLDTHIQRLRHKLGWEKQIQTLYKIGYLLLAEEKI